MTILFVANYDVVMRVIGMYILTPFSSRTELASCSPRRRATGLPPYGDFIGAMEVADGSRFGMPGDSEIYGS